MTDLLSDNDRNLDVLKYLTETLPDDTFLRSYNNDNGVISITGDSGSYSDLISHLRDAPLLKDVVEKGSVSKDRESGKDRFQLETKLK